jgi:hypothetical protein
MPEQAVLRRFAAANPPSRSQRILGRANSATAGPTWSILRSPALRTRPVPAGPTSATPDIAGGEAGAGRPVLALAFAAGAIGLCLGGLGLVIVTFAQVRHDPAAVAWIEAAQSTRTGPADPGRGCS